MLMCVDDLIYTGNDQGMLLRFRSSIEKEFEMSYLGLMQYFLGIEVVQTEFETRISQRMYAAEILKRFIKMVECNVVVNPVTPGCKCKLVASADTRDEIVFKQMVRSLM
ncbi:putative RNA-directed DNA polymerase [Helianthus annuus]|nr:putative RNA-directed DNA polymerase [Helianthus annuus]